MLLFVLLFIASVFAQDPASSWLTYAKAAGDGSKLLYFYAETTTPPSPRYYGGTPAFWIGIEPSPALDLIQPIIPKYMFDEYAIWVERFNWHTGQDYQSQHIGVKPGDKVWGSVEFENSTNTYRQCAGLLNSSVKVCATMKLWSAQEIFTDAYVVLEHQPSICAQLPTSRKIVYENIKVKWESGRTDPKWTSHVKAPVCNSTTQILSPTKVQISWDI